MELVPKPSVRLTLQDAADLLGVHYMTAYHYVRVGRLAAEQSEGRWWVKRSDVDTLRRPPNTATRTPRGHRGSPDWTAYRRRLSRRLLAGDAIGGWSVVEDAMRGGAEPPAIYVELVGPALRDIGKRWERSQLTVADEHQATAAARRIVGRLTPMFNRRGRTRGTVLVGGAAGDPHDLPVTMLADVVRGSGFAVIDLGANTPIESFVATARRMSPVAICISASTADGLTVATSIIEALRAAGVDAPILLGGPAVDDRAAHAAGADGWAGDAVGAVAEIDRVRFSDK